APQPPVQVKRQEDRREEGAWGVTQMAEGSTCRLHVTRNIKHCVLESRIVRLPRYAAPEARGIEGREADAACLPPGPILGGATAVSSRSIEAAAVVAFPVPPRRLAPSSEDIAADGLDSAHGGVRSRRRCAQSIR